MPQHKVQTGKGEAKLNKQHVFLSLSLSNLANGNYYYLTFCFPILSDIFLSSYLLQVTALPNVLCLQNMD